MQINNIRKHVYNYLSHIHYPTQLRCNSSRLSPHFSPRNTGHYLLCVNTILVLDSKIEQWIQKRVWQKVRFKSQLDKFGVFGIVVVLLCFNSWVWHRCGLHIKSKLFSRFCDKRSKFIDRELLSKLIEDPKLTSLCWICNGNLNTLNRISDVKISPGLAY